MSKLFLFNGCSYANAAGKGLYKQKCSVYAVSQLCCSYAVVPEQKARTTYDNLLRLIDDPDVLEPLRFLRQREIVHYQRFGEGLRIATDRLNSKNFYAFNPSFDKNCVLKNNNASNCRKR